VETSKGTPQEKINRKYINLTPHDSEELIPSGMALRTSIQACCTEGLTAYAKNKAQQLKTLGFSGVNYKINTRFKAMKAEELVDAFLGIRKNIETTHTSTIENRFNIPILISESESTILTIEPHPIDECSITFRGAKPSDVVSFPGKIYTPAIPNLPAELRKIRVQSDCFAIIVKNDSFEFSIDLGHDKELTAVEWRDIFKAIEILSSQHSTIEVRGKDSQIRFSTSTQAITSLAIDMDENSELIACCIALHDIFKVAGYATQPSISLSALHEAGPHIKYLSDAINGQTSGANLVGIVAFPDGIEKPKAAILANTLHIGQYTLIYYGIAHLLIKQCGDMHEVSTGDFVVKRIQILEPPSISQYEYFVKSAEEAEGITVSLRCGVPKEVSATDYIEDNPAEHMEQL